MKKSSKKVKETKVVAEKLIEEASTHLEEVAAAAPGVEQAEIAEAIVEFKELVKEVMPSEEAELTPEQVARARASMMGKVGKLVTISEGGEAMQCIGTLAVGEGEQETTFSGEAEALPAEVDPNALIEGDKVSVKGEHLHTGKVFTTGKVKSVLGEDRFVVSGTCTIKNASNVRTMPVNRSYARDELIKL